MLFRLRNAFNNSINQIQMEANKPMDNPRVFRQGDVLFVESNIVLSDVKGKKLIKDSVVAEGEVTGHFHKVENGNVWEGRTPATLDFSMWVVAGEDTQVTHPEHGTIMLPPGTWEVRRQREYNPVRNRMVLD